MFGLGRIGALGSPSPKAPAGAPAWVQTKAIEFNDAGAVSNEYISVDDHASLDFTTEMTWAGWVKGPSASFSSIFTKGDYGTNTRSYGVFQDYGGAGSAKASFLVSNNGTTHKVMTTSEDVFDNTWKHLVWTFNANTVKAYVNGVEDASLTTTQAATVNSLNNSALPIRMGQFFGNGSPTIHWSGRMCEVSLWNVALDQTEITELYNAGAAFDARTHTSVANLVSFWRLGDDDTIAASGILDSHGTNHGTPTNMEAGDIKDDAI